MRAAPCPRLLHPCCLVSHATAAATVADGAAVPLPLLTLPLLLLLQLNVTVSNHLRDLPQLTGSIKYEIVTDASREALTAAWKAWMEETCEE